MVVAKGTVLVLDLDREDGSALREHHRMNDLTQPVEPLSHRRHKERIATANLHCTIFEQPRWKPSEFPFSANIRSRPEDDVKAFLLCLSQVFSKIVLSRKIEVPG